MSKRRVNHSQKERLRSNCASLDVCEALVIEEKDTRKKELDWPKASDKQEKQGGSTEKEEALANS